MSDLELFVKDEIKKLVPNCCEIELNAMVDSSSYSVEFFVIINGERHQCYEMIEDGIFSEEDFDIVAKEIADYIRGMDCFKKEGINKFDVVMT